VEIKTAHDGSSLRLSDFEYMSKDAFGCRLTVWSNGFGCDCRFWIESIEKALAKLEEMDRDLLGEATLKEDFGSDFIRIEVNHLGHVHVTGKVERHTDWPQALEFGFKTDQTVLKPLISSIRALVAARRDG
jgi:hypothetical protein